MQGYLNAFFGGVLIGAAALLFLWGNGRILGVSGIVGGVLKRQSSKEHWRYGFLIGLIAGGSLMLLILPEAFKMPPSFSPYLVTAAGLLVGYGTRMSNGCTSGHGVCGVSRLSKRSIAATAIFMAAGVITVFLTRNVLNLGVL